MARLVPASESLQKLAAKPWVDRIPGGKAEGHSPEEFDPEQLAIGAQEETEHANDPAVATEIAMDHLIKDPAYYQKLKLIEGGDEQGAETGKVACVELAGQLLARAELRKEAGLLGAVPAAIGGALRGAASKVGKLFPRAATAAAKPAAGIVPKAAGKGFSTGKALLLGGGGLAAYGAYKGVPWAAKSALQESSTAMAPGMKFRLGPNYGYDDNPWGNSAPNMGAL